MSLRKTKIVCTIGPAVRELDTLKEILQAGMNIARFNFSHGDHAYHRESVQMVREASKQTGIPVALMLDTKGPEIRTGCTIDDRNIQLVGGKQIVITTDEVDGTADRLSISYKTLPQEILPGKHIYIADGVIDLEVLEIQGNDIICLIKQGGEVGSRKNVNVVGVRTSLPAMTEKDERDILFGIEQQFDFLAASFIRKASDVLEIRRFLDEHCSTMHIIAKIEDEEGLDNIRDIIHISDGIMVARGDLGVQLQTEDIPLAQKRIIHECNLANKPVSTATQMLDSMIHNPRPTRAESSDVANAIFDGTDAVMLSGETASGAYPVLAVHTMHKIAIRIEDSTEYRKKMDANISPAEMERDISTSIAKSAFLLAENIDASAILTPTLHGNTPKLISKYRPKQAIIAPTPSENVRRNLLLYWGVHPIHAGQVTASDDMINNALAIALQKKYIRNNDRVVTVAGIPIHSPVMLNTIRVHVISTILGKGSDGIGKMCTGKIVKVNDLSDAVLKIRGDRTEILLAKKLDTGFKPLLPKLRGVILQQYSTIPPEEILMLNQNLVLISDVSNAMMSFEHELIVTMDGEEKLIYEGVVEEK